MRRRPCAPKSRPGHLKIVFGSLTGTCKVLYEEGSFKRSSTPLEEVLFKVLSKELSTPLEELLIKELHTPRRGPY